MEGLVFEARPDDAVFTPPALSDPELEEAQKQLVLELSWKEPEKFGHLQSSFEDHIKMAEKLSEEKGIVIEYSPEVLELFEEVAELQEALMSYDDFARLQCLCPGDFGISPDAARELHNQQQDHTGHNHQEQSDGKKKKKSKAKKTSVNWLDLFLAAKTE